MKISALEYVDVICSQLFAMASDCGLDDFEKTLAGLLEVGGRIRCAQAADRILGRHLAAAHIAGESGQDIHKQAVPQWQTVAVEDYPQQEARARGKKNPPR